MGAGVERGCSGAGERVLALRGRREGEGGRDLGGRESCRPSPRVLDHGAAGMERRVQGSVVQPTKWRQERPGGVKHVGGLLTLLPFSTPVLEPNLEQKKNPMYLHLIAENNHQPSTGANIQFRIRWKFQICFFKVVPRYNLINQQNLCAVS